MYLDADRFGAAQTDPHWFDPDRHEIALREALEVIPLEGDDGQHFSGLHLNRDFAGNPAIVRLGGLFEDVRTMDGRYTAYQLAAANPENPVIAINLPGHGESDPLTPAQRQEIIRRSGVGMIAGSQALAASSLMETDDVITVGQSAGARLAPDFTIAAEEMGLRPLTLVTFTPVGLDARPSPATTFSYFWDGYQTEEGYYEGPDNERLDDAQDQFEAQLTLANLEAEEEDELADLRERRFRDDLRTVLGGYARFMVMDSPLADDGGFEAIRRALDHNPDMSATMVSAGLDRVTRWSAIQARTIQLSDDYEGRLTWNVWANDSHSMGIASQQPRFAAAVRAVVESL